MTIGGGISIHAVDIHDGIKACGLRFGVHRLDAGTQALLHDETIGVDGMWDNAASGGRLLQPSRYVVTFEVAAYFAQREVPLTDPPFLEAAEFHFRVADPEFHIHLPFKFSPWGYSLFRGNP